jgi:seryl-tRNA synthetase
MLDLNFIREKPDLVKKAARDKGLDPAAVDRVLALDQTRRELQIKVENLRAKRNQLTKNDLNQGRQIKLELKKLEPALKTAKNQLQEALLWLPGIPSEDTPVGPDAAANKLVRSWGQPPKFAFKPKSHIELGTALNLLDLERGAKVAGFRGYFLKNEAALMHLGLMHYALETLVKRGFTPLVPPVVVKDFTLVNTGHFPWGQLDIYKTYDDEKEKDIRYLAGTAEVPLVSYHSGEVLNEKDLPICYAGFSPCFRREIGTYGKDAKGLYRIHEFLKIEQVVICKNDLQESLNWLEKLAENAEIILQGLKLPYRVVQLSTGEMGQPQYKKYDIETWMPSRNDYGETMSDSAMLEFQSRRANLRYRTKTGEVKFVHMLNNTALASPRILIAIWENYQQADGSILIPEVLQKYVGKKIIKHVE